MRKSFPAVACLVFCPLLGPGLFAGAQSGAVIPQGGAGHANQASCVILKRMGPADEITSHLYSFGIRGKQFQFVEGKLPEGFPFHGRLTDHDVRNLQGRGAEVLILEPHYTAEDLNGARFECKGMTQKDPNQTAAPNTAPQPEGGAGPANPSAPPSGAPAPPPAAVQATVTVESTPLGADIEVDGSFVGSTPSTVNVAAGSHTIVVKKKGFADWTRTLNVNGGSIHLSADLDAAAPAAAPAPASAPTSAPAPAPAPQ